MQTTRNVYDKTIDIVIVILKNGTRSFFRDAAVQGLHNETLTFFYEPATMKVKSGNPWGGLLTHSYRTAFVRLDEVADFYVEKVPHTWTDEQIDEHIQGMPVTDTEAVFAMVDAEQSVDPGIFS